MIQITEEFRKTYPEAHIGVLLIKGISNQKVNEELSGKKRELEDNIRRQFEGKDRNYISSLDTNKAYSEYYKKFKKTYHVLMQLESIAFKGKSIPDVDCLVEAMFMSEIKNQLLTAGHDISKLELPIEVGIANGEEKFIAMNGKEQVCTQGDMFMYDRKGVISSVIQGPDSRTKINLNTTDVLYVVYAPEGVKEEVIFKHLEDIKETLSLLNSEFSVEELKVL
ncbi:MAG: phenylalanine--tRNA ligase beta subunit-related protein [Anaerocolumna sp.]